MPNSLNYIQSWHIVFHFFFLKVFDLKNYSSTKSFVFSVVTFFLLLGGLYCCRGVFSKWVDIHLILNFNAAYTTLNISPDINDSSLSFRNTELADLNQHNQQYFCNCNIALNSENGKLIITKYFPVIQDINAQARIAKVLDSATCNWFIYSSIVLFTLSY